MLQISLVQECVFNAGMFNTCLFSAILFSAGMVQESALLSAPKYENIYFGAGTVVFSEIMFDTVPEYLVQECVLKSLFLFFFKLVQAE